MKPSLKQQFVSQEPGKMGSVGGKGVESVQSVKWEPRVCLGQVEPWSALHAT